MLQFAASGRLRNSISIRPSTMLRTRCAVWSILGAATAWCWIKCWRNQVEENANHPSVNIGNQRVNLAPTSKYPGAAPAQQLPKDQEIQKIIDAGAAADFVAKTPVPDNPPPKVPVTSQQPTATPSIFGRAFDALTAPQTPPAPQTPTAPQTPSLTTPMRAGLPAPQAPSASQTPPTAPAGPAATPGQRSDGSPLGSM